MNLTKSIIFFVLLITFLYQPIDAQDGYRSLPVEEFQKKVYERVWRAPIVFDPKVKFVIFVKPGEDGWKGTTKLHRYDIEKKETQQLYKSMKGRFAYATISNDGTYLAFQFQSGKPPKPLRFNAPFFERKLFVSETQDLSNKTEIPKFLGAVPGWNKTELMPLFGLAGKNIFMSVGRFADAQPNEVVHITGLEIDAKFARDMKKIKQYEMCFASDMKKRKQYEKCFEFLPTLIKSNGQLLTLMNPDKY